MPDHRTIRDHKYLKLFGTLLHEPNLWHLNRRSASGAFGVGIFCAFVPIPFQMVLAAALAIPMRVNLPISVALVWLTNPITMPPVFYFCYKVGAWILGTPEQAWAFELSFEWLAHEMGTLWKPFLLGCLLMGTLSSTLGYFTVRSLWRLQVVRHNERKKNERRLRELLGNDKREE